MHFPAYFIIDTGDSTVYTNEGSYSEPYVIKTISPQIEGHYLP